MASCATCGTEGVAGEQFCRSCGAALPMPTRAPMASAPDAPSAPGRGGRRSAPTSVSSARWPTGPAALGHPDHFVIIIAADLVFIILAAIVHPLVFLLWIVGLLGWLFMAWQVGETGQSPGMRVIGLKCVQNRTGQVLGFGMGVVRGLANIINSIICYIGWLFPLWDNQRQTVADKIMSTYVVTVPKQAFSLLPRE